ncbi:hypothetical protein BDY24DRAFT_439935 [Mrakia frigida]|uniref:uncharacterized protein n=1 Tax=Mrakia frigida TaxID=29902 RepID=UPI003FCBF12E
MLPRSTMNLSTPSQKLVAAILSLYFISFFTFFWRDLGLGSTLACPFGTGGDEEGGRLQAPSSSIGVELESTGPSSRIHVPDWRDHNRRMIQELRDCSLTLDFCSTNQDTVVLLPESHFWKVTEDQNTFTSSILDAFTNIGVTYLFEKTPSPSHFSDTIPGLVKARVVKTVLRPPRLLGRASGDL